jgi:hypothetical protein
MARYRKVDPRMWGDAKFRAMGQNAKFLWLYLLTGPETTSLPGLIVGGQAHFAEALGWPAEAFQEAFGEVFAKGLAKADWDARLVWVRNAVRYNPPESPNAVLGWRDHWDNIPECQLKVEAFAKAFAKGCRKPSPIQEQEQEQEQEGERAANAATPTAIQTSLLPDEPEPPQPDTAAKAKRACQLPDSWTPNDSHRDIAKAEGRDVDREATKFRDHFTANGKPMKDWDRTFNNWLRSDYGKPARPTTPQPGKRSWTGIPLDELEKLS